MKENKTFTAWYCEKCGYLFKVIHSGKENCINCLTELKKIKLIRVDDVIELLKDVVDDKPLAYGDLKEMIRKLKKLEGEKW